MGSGAVLMSVLLIMFGVVDSSAMVRSYGCEAGMGQIIIYGDIAPETATEFRKTVQSCVGKAKRVALVVNVYSNGGDLEAALNIGRIVRAHQMLVRVREEGACLSSCVYILAGGVVRIIEGQVGIHAPSYPSETDSTYAVSKNKFDALKLEIKSYLSEMNLPQSLYDNMLLTPSYDIHILTREELARYGLSQEDPVYREAKEVQEAMELGISRKELGRRQRLIDKICLPLAQKGDMEGWAECSDRTLKYH